MLLQAFQIVANFASPRKERSPQMESFRGEANYFLADLDTRLQEFSTSLLAVIVAYQVLALHDSSTPFLSSALRILNLPIDWWAILLGGVGMAQFIAFLRGAKDDKAMRMRINLSACAALVWCFTILAIATTVPFVFASILRYVLNFIVNAVIFLSLNARLRRITQWDTANAQYRTDS